MQNMDEWGKTMKSLQEQANDTEMKVIAKLAAAIINEKELSAITDNVERELRKNGSAALLEKVKARASDKEIRIIARVAGAIIGRNKKREGY